MTPPTEIISQLKTDIRLFYDFVFVCLLILSVFLGAYALYSQMNQDQDENKLRAKYREKEKKNKQ